LNEFTDARGNGVTNQEEQRDWVDRANSSQIRVWKFEGFRRELGSTPLLMGIVNVTPDSFSDGGRFLDAEAAIEHGLRLVGEGADILDIGGESTRPASEPVPAGEELNRVIPVIERLAATTHVPISIDTSKAEVARRALQAGARIVNDISGLRFDPAIVDVCSEFRCGIVCMHIQGTPQTMQANPQYDDVVAEICDYFRQRLESLQRHGIPAERVVLDPGVGFGKTAQHNIEILSHIDQLRSLGRPVLIGHSRKRFLQKVVNREVDERLFGTVGVSVGLALQHVDILRVHDVAANRDAISAFRAVCPRE
jgi:dihydropteroate synthase